MENVKLNKEMSVCNIILSLERPFKISQLLEETQREGILDSNFVLEILDQLCDSGIIKYSEIEDDVWAYRKAS